MAATQPIAIDRKAGIRALEKVIQDSDPVAEIVRRLDEGTSIIMFPEGTRVSPGERGRYNPGGALLAMRAGVPVVPVAHNAGRYWPRRSWLKHPGVIQVVIGPPIATEGARAKLVSAAAEEWIETTMKILDRDYE